MPLRGTGHDRCDWASVSRAVLFVAGRRGSRRALNVLTRTRLVRREAAEVLIWPVFHDFIELLFRSFRHRALRYSISLRFTFLALVR